MTPILAAGAVLWRRAGDSVEVALVHRPRYDDWSLPKGKLDPGESMPFAAVREVAEETGFTARLRGCLGDVTYEVPEGSKRVRYWSAQAAGGGFEPNDETDELRWCGVTAAAGLLSYRRDVTVLERFVAVGVVDSTVLFVRHAKAGSRDRWDGPDHLRPLSGSGREQARHIAALLGLFGPDRVISAPAVRCLDTVAPLGMPILHEPLLGEDGYWADPTRGLARFRKIAARPGVTAVCSQGGVIPDVVRELIAGVDLEIEPDGVTADKAAKASTWVLGFAGDVLRTADYHPCVAG